MFRIVWQRLQASNDLNNVLSYFYCNDLRENKEKSGKEIVEEDIYDDGEETLKQNEVKRNQAPVYWRFLAIIFFL